MSIQRLLHFVVGAVTCLKHRDERGLSQSTENVILLVGAVTIAGIVIGLVTTYVRGQLVLIGPP